MSYSINQLRDFSTFFSRREVLRWFNNDFESINIKLQRYNLAKKYKGVNYLNIFKKTYKILEENYPFEYILKNEFLNKWLRNELGYQTSIIYNEFRIGKAIADLAMFNGVSKVFEIKTILDKEYRLSNQLNEYKKIFNEIYIIVPLVHLNKYTELDKNIGIIAHDLSNKRFDLIRTSDINDNIDIEVLMQVLHTKEYIKIVKEYYNELPAMNSFNQFKICKELISKIPFNKLNILFLETMKARKVNNIFFEKRYNEFNQICLSLNLKQIERDNLILNLKSNRL